MNTIDVGAPTSVVSQLSPAVTTPNFLVQWSGQDDAGGAGIASYDVFVSTDGGPFKPWLLATSETSAEFVDGASGKTYGFYSVARDAVGNVEITTGQADTQTFVIIHPWTNPNNIYDVNGKDGVTALDALVVVNELARNAVSDPETGELVAIPPSGYAPPFYDVSQDGKATARDALLVINQLARINLASGEQIDLAFQAINHNDRGVDSWILAVVDETRLIHDAASAHPMAFSDDSATEPSVWSDPVNDDETDESELQDAIQMLAFDLAGLR